MRRRGGIFGVLAVAVFALGACGGGARRGGPPRPPVPQAPAMFAHFIDVGQGDATLLEFPCAAMLIDTGGEQNGGFDSVNALTAYLDAFFARRTDLDRTLALVLITHAHIDHTRGLPTVLERYNVKNVVDNGHTGSSGGPQMEALHAWLGVHPSVGHREIHLADMVENRGFSDGVVDPIACPDVDPEIRTLWGAVQNDPGWRETPWGKPFDNENNHSLAVRVDYGRSSFLFTGDLEAEALDTFVARYRGTPLLDVDVYKVGHHGSRNGTTEPLLRAMTPRVAIFSMGSAVRRWDWTAWQYGHPGGGVVELMEKSLIDYRPETSVMVGRRAMEFSTMKVHRASYGTGWEGTITIEASTRGRIKVKVDAGAAPQAAGGG